MTIKIFNDGRCACSAADVCPLGRAKSQSRCTATELVKAGHTVEHLGLFKDRAHYQNGADSCACGELWPCALLQLQRNRPSPTIDELIDRSSIGEGLRNIRENGIDAELARLEAQPSFRINHRGTRKPKASTRKKGIGARGSKARKKS